MMSAEPSGAARNATFASGRRTGLTVYAEVMVPRIFSVWAHELLDELDLTAGEAVLDVACGAGSVTRLAAARSGPTGRVMGCDLNPAMLALAAELGPVAHGAAIEYVEAPADHMPVSDGSFDVVTCQQGLQFFPDRPAALGEMSRALRARGRVGVAVWKRIEECPPFSVLAEAIRQVAGDTLANRYSAGPWGLSRAGDLRRLLERAGFTDVKVADRSLPVTFEGGPAQLAAMYAASGIAAEIEALPPQDSARLLAVVARLSRPLLAGGAVHSQMAAHLVTALR